MSLFQYLDLAGVAVFAATGALAASRKQMDLIGFVFLACLTGTGGGTVRDLVLGISPVFWIADGRVLVVCAFMAVLLYFTAGLVEYRYRLLVWLDAIGLSTYSVLGAHIGIAAGAPPAGAIATGMMTACLGGILRDVVSAEPSVLLRREIYVTAALTGAGVYTGLAVMASVPPVVSAAIAVSCALFMRGGAIAFGWTLPGHRHRVGRTIAPEKRDAGPGDLR